MFREQPKIADEEVRSGKTESTKEPIPLHVDHERVGLIEVGDLMVPHSLDDWRKLYNTFATSDSLRGISAQEMRRYGNTLVDFETFERCLLASTMSGLNIQKFKEFKAIVRRVNGLE